MKSRTIKVDYLARVEGEGALYVKIKDDTVVDIKFKIFEPPRFFEAFLRGRTYNEAPDITARICGICPYRLSDEFSACNGRRIWRQGRWPTPCLAQAYLLWGMDRKSCTPRVYATCPRFSWLPRCNTNGKRTS